MNYRLILSMIGRILTLEALFMTAPLIVALIYKESLLNIFSILVIIAILLALGYLTSNIDLNHMHFGVKEGFVAVTATWFLMSLFGCLPLMINGQIPNFIDAFFEIASGFTTTGASVLPAGEYLSKSMMFWRSFTHFIGGMGILVFALAVFPKKVDGTVYVMKAEMPGPTFGKLVSKADITAKILYKIYVSMTVVLIIILVVVGMEPYDAMIHAFGTAGTGGFSNKAFSIAEFNSPLIDYILAVFMFAFSINFYIYYLALVGRGKEILRSEELKAYFFILFVAIALISANVWSMYDSFSEMFRHVFFTVTSIMSTTGFANTDFTLWPSFSHFVLNLLIFIGSCAGSTGGGLKVSRLIILIKAGVNEIKQSIAPRRILTITEDSRRVPDNIIRCALVYFFIYVITFLTLLFFVSLDNVDGTTAFNAVSATLNTNAPGVEIVGLDGTYSFFSPFSKIMLTLAMIIGRLEIIPILILFMPRTWRNKY